MAVAFDNAASGKSTTNNNACTVTMTPGVLTNACAIVVIAWGNGSAVTVSSVKLDATTSFTRVGGVTNSGGAVDGLDIWRLVGASLTNASHTFDVTMSGNTLFKFEHVITFQGVDQTTPCGTIATDGTDTTSPTAVSPGGGGASDLIVAGGMIDDGVGNGTYGVSNLTQRGTTQNETTIEGSACLAGTAGGTQASVGITWSTSALGSMTAGVVVKAVAAAGFNPGWTYGATKTTGGVF